MLDRQRREPCVGDARPADPRFEADSRENRPVTRTGAHRLAMRLSEQIVAERENLLDRAGLSEYARIGRNPRHRAQRQGRHAKAPVPKDDPVEPAFADRVARRIGAKRVDQHIDVRQDHGRRPAASRSSISSSAAESSRLTPGLSPPVAELTGGGTRLVRAAGARSARTRRRPSSIRAVSERPSASALRLARLTRSSGRRTVVLSVICHDI